MHHIIPELLLGIILIVVYADDNRGLQGHYTIHVKSC